MAEGHLARRKKSAGRGPTAKKIRDAAERARVAIGSGSFSDVGPLELVGLWAWLHERVYEVDPVPEVTGKEGLAATSAAKRLLKNEFEEDAARAVDFVRWSWQRERARENWRRENGQDGGRLSWRLQFGDRLVVDYRIAKKRRRKA